MLQILFVVALCWGVLFFLDTMFTTCMFAPYLKMLEKNGLIIKPFMVMWIITRFNRSFRTLGRFCPSLLRKWFDVGALVTCFCVIPSMALFIISFYQTLKAESEENYSGQLLMPVIPGYNIPLSHLLYYLIVIFLCSLVHELGHAIAASREKIAIESCGVGLYGIFPVAFVHLYKEQLRQLSLWQQLRIFSAGVWHNIILSCFALLLIHFSPFLLSPIYEKGSGITILHVNWDSGVAGPGGLIAGDQVFSISDCHVHDYMSWTECLEIKNKNLQPGFCVTKDFILKEDISEKFLDTNSENCCGDSSGHLCFSYMDLLSQKKVCLHARKVVEMFKVCSKSEDCKDKSQCLSPVLLSESDRFVDIERKGKNSVLYVGSLNELSSSVTISSWLSKFPRISAYFAEMFETFLIYTIVISGGLAALNLIPCYALDGEYLCENLVHLCLMNYIPNFTFRAILIKFLHISGVLILAMTAVITAFKVIKS